MDAAIDHFESERLVDALGRVVVDPGVGGHLGAAQRACPFFSSFEEEFADASAAHFLFYKPAFDKADGMLGIAAIGMRAKAGFQKADESSGTLFGNKN